MAIQKCFSILIFTILFLAIFAQNSVASDDHNEAGALFTYGGTTGPANWGKLDPKFRVCASGKLQSPVNLVRSHTVLNKNLKPLIRGYKPVDAELVTNGVNIGIHFEGDAGEMNIDGKNYTLRQLHWHSPSEHRIDGIQHPLELHIVHQLGNGSFSVIGILYDYGEADPLITKVQPSLAKLATRVRETHKLAKEPLGIFDAKLVKRNSHRFFRYTGSLTTPPCTENVIWNVIPRVRTVTKEQIQALKAPLEPEYRHNCRPVQPLNGRTLEIAPRLNP